MNIDTLRKKFKGLHGKYSKMTVRQRQTCYGHYISWRLRNIETKLKEIERSVGRDSRPVGNYTIKWP